MRVPVRAGDRLALLGIVLTIVGFAGVTLALTAPDVVGGTGPLIGGLALNALVAGPFLAGRRFAPRLRRFIPPWLPW